MSALLRRSPLDPVVAPDRLTALRPTARRVRSRYRLVTAPARRLPDFVVIGAQKSGTTTLFDHLARHPDVRPSATKEVHFLDREYWRGEQWYRGHFALRLDRRLTGEATPSYLVFPPAPARARALLPDARLVAVLRDPVDRAYSHYHHEVAKGFESLSFEEAIEREADRLAASDRTATTDGPLALGHALEHHSYLHRGRYAEQLERWLAHFPREQLLVLPAEQLYRDPDTALARVHDHLGVRHVVAPTPVRRNQRRYPPMDPTTRRRLDDLFAPDTARLERLLDTSLPWG